MDIRIENTASAAPVSPVQATGDTDGQVKNPYIPPRKRSGSNAFGSMLDTKIAEISGRGNLSPTPSISNISTEMNPGEH